MTSSRPITPLVAAFLAAALWFPTASPAGPARVRSELLENRLERMDAFFNAHPELRLPRGSTWKHYTKIRRFLDARTIDGVRPTAADRVRAWEVGNERRASGQSAGSGWFAIGPPNISGRIVDLKFHPANPQKIYAASASGGLWISDDGGETWRTTTDGLPSLSIGAVVVLPTNPDVVLVATGEGINWLYSVFGVGIYKSTDGGETWAPTSLSYDITDNHGYHVMEANPITGTILAGANDGLWRSVNEGDTWIRVRPAADWYDVEWKPGSSTRVYAAKGSAPSNNGVKVSDDDGLTWSSVSIGLPPSNEVSKVKLATTPANPSLLYAHVGNSQTYGTHGIYRSLNDGASWSARNTTTNISGTQGSYAVTIAVDPDDSDRVIAGGIRLYLSTDGGASFIETGAGDPLGDETSVHFDHHAIAWEPGSTSNLWVGTDGGNWRSTNEGDTWSPKRDGLITTQYYDVCLDPNDPAWTMGGSQDNGLTWVETEESPWFPSTLTADGFACFVEPLNPDVIYSEYQFGGHIRSDDGGQSWQFTDNGLTGNSRPFAPLDLDLHQTGRLYTSTLDGIFRTTNGQDLWVNVGSHAATWLSISPVDGGVIWTVDSFASSNPVRITTNDGGTWTPAASYGFAAGNETKILAHPTDVASAFVVFAGYSGVAHVAVTTDFGATWQDASGDFPPDPANTIVVDPDDPVQWFVGTDTGVYHTGDGGTTWNPYGASFPNVFVHDLEIHRGARKLVAGTYGRGTWETALPSATAASEPAPTSHPYLMLDAPYPNPARDQTFFRFASKRPGPVTLNVYDVTGRLAGRVTSRRGGDGVIRTAAWDVRGLQSGVYFAKLQAGAESLSRRLVISK